MKIFKIPIIPYKSTFVGEQNTLDYQAICIFAATGFFLDDDTFFKEQKVLRPSNTYQIENNTVVSKNTYFKWHYRPVERPLDQIVQEFAALFETIIKEQVGDKKVILPLSGGLDSRTQAAALNYLKIPVSSYSYEFTDGHKETNYSEKIAKVCNFSFSKWEISYGYLWNCIEELAKINDCFSEFTHPRQMAFLENYKKMGDIFSLGHWGDVLFDDMGVSDDLSFNDQVEIIIKKIVKKGGIELAESLWNEWNLDGSFKDYLKNRIITLLKEIDIPQSANAQIRAFKSLYWAPRWTTTNLSVFENAKPITLPYYDNRMCEFICSVPEHYLSGRQIQIAYLKMRMPELAKITWQDHRPFNLYNYHWDKKPWNIPYRIFNKVFRILKNKKIVQRNWELQFLGEENDKQLQKWLFENEKMQTIIPVKLINIFYKNFQNKDAVNYSHPVSILLTLSLFFKNQK